MDTRDGLCFLAVMCLITPFIMVWTIPEPHVFYLFEASWFASVMLVQGFALAGFLYGLSLEDDGMPLLAGLVCLIISVLWLVATGPLHLQPYVYTPSTSSLSGWKEVLFGIWYLGSAASFIGTAEFIKRAVNELRGLQGSAKT